jgi:hypothetical protein
VCSICWVVFVFYLFGSDLVLICLFLTFCFLFVGLCLLERRGSWREMIVFYLFDFDLF